MGEDRGLGPARGARGVDHVGGAVAVERDAGRRLLFPRQELGVEDEAGDAGKRRRSEAHVTHEGGEVGVAGGSSQAFGGVRRIQWHVGPAGLPDAEERYEKSG